MPTFRYAKLVRDNIPQWHNEAGYTVHGSRLKGAALRQALVKKLHEEADEVDAAQSRTELIEEIADVQQIIDDLCVSEAISSEALSSVKQEKATRKGGFLHGEYIDTVMIPDENDRWARYCRQSPDKYLEV